MFNAHDGPGGVVNEPPEGGANVRDNREASRFEVLTDGGVATLDYIRRPDSMVLVHTEVPEAMRGRGLANVLAAYGVDTARREGLRIVAQCPVVRKYLRNHPAPTGG